MIRLILVNMSAMSADLLRVALAGQSQLEVAGTASNPDELAALLLRNDLQIALIASSGSEKSSEALAYLEQIRAAASTMRAIVLSEDMAREDIVQFFYRGARGLVSKSETDFSVLVKCIHCVSAGQVWANSSQLEQLLCSLKEPRLQHSVSLAGAALLSPREEQVLHLLTRGLSNRELARTLKLSEHTIKNHLFRIFEKLGVSSRMEAVLWAMSRGLQQVPPSGRPGATVVSGA